MTTTHSLAQHMKTVHLGKHRAITNRRLSVFLGFTDQGTNGRQDIANSKSLTTLINEAVSEGYPICCCSRGYFYAENDSEIKACAIRYMKMVENWRIKASDILRTLPLERENQLPLPL